jgi:CubicO group peptidase (beta-lactamase class C family)
MRTSARTVVLSVFPLCGVVTCSRDIGPLDERLTEAIGDRLWQSDVKGASTAIILVEGTIHRIVPAFSQDTVRMHPDMLFAIGSITKNMVATLVLQLTDKGVHSLDDSLHERIGQREQT